MARGFRPTGVVEVETMTLRHLRARRAQCYLRGPILVQHLGKAARLPGKALAMLLAIHYQRNVSQKKAVSVSSSTLSDFGVDRNARRRALRHLESAKLITVKRLPGKRPRVELLL